MTKAAVAEKSEQNGAQGSALFPMPKSPLGDACTKFVEITQEIADLKVDKGTAEEKILIEMAKEGRDTLTVTVGNDNWLFEVKLEEKKLRCVKQTRQPKPGIEEE